MYSVTVCEQEAKNCAVRELPAIVFIERLILGGMLVTG